MLYDEGKSPFYKGNVRAVKLEAWQLRPSNAINPETAQTSGPLFTEVPVGTVTFMYDPAGTVTLVKNMTDRVVNYDPTKLGLAETWTDLIVADVSAIKQAKMHKKY